MAAILFDLDGVIYESDRLIAGAADTVNWFIDSGTPYLFLTNTTSRPRSELVKKLADFGIDTNEEKFLTPAVAATQWLRTQSVRNIALFVPETTRDEFSGFVDLTEARDNDDDISLEAVIVGDLGEGWTFAKMNQIFRLLIENPEARLLALGMTRYWRTQSGLQMDVGPMIKAFEYATDRNAVVTGKPSKDFFDAAARLLKDEDIVMIGDDIRGDVEASQNAGLTAILVKTGKFADTDLDTGIKPDAVLESIAQLPAWWHNNMKPIPGV